MILTIRRWARPLVRLIHIRAGDCYRCGEWSSRLITGLCEPCARPRRVPVHVQTARGPGESA